VYCEKPSTLAIAEGRSMVTALAKLGTVWQCGTQRRSIPSYAFVVDVVRSGRIGKLHLITTSLGEGWTSDALPIPVTEPAPEVFDYDRWLGQAPWAPYSPQRVGMWRLDWDLSAGAIVDMGPHYFDFAQWAHGDEMSGPVEYEGFGIFLREKKLNTIPGIVDVRARYADGTRLRIDSGPKGVRFDGDEGWIQLTDEGAITAGPKSVLAGREVPHYGWNVMAPHIRNFLDCMRSRKPTVSPPEIAHRSHTIAHCANLSIRLDRKLCWDPETELFIGDEQANNMLARSMRAPWRI
jgi:predicted dehydrogenase